MQSAEQVPEIGRAWPEAVLGKVPPERHDAAVTNDRLVDRQRLHARETDPIKPSSYAHRRLQARPHVRRRHQRDARDGICRGEVIDGGGKQPDQPRAAAVQPDNARRPVAGRTARP